MISQLWPIILVVLSNIMYNIASKSVPKNCSPFVILIVTYLTATLLSFIFYLIFDLDKNIKSAFSNINWSGFFLGLSMVGLEIGFIFIYRSGWKISTASLLVNILLALALIAVGIVFYNESLTVRQIIGVVFCLIGVSALIL
ncbi:MAG: EamA family transporter [Desulfovibrio sp.]|nr:EamA family transporter [Desulfovibrio sp.]